MGATTRRSIPDEAVMSLLQQDSDQLDDAAKGEELTRGTSHVIWAAVAATVVVSIAIAIYVIASRSHRSPAEKFAVWAHPQHTTTSGVDSSGAPIPQQNLVQVFVFTKVSLKNQSDHPIFLNNVMTNVTLDDGIHSSYAANKGDYDRLFVAYPDLTVTHGPAISPLDTEIDPGQTVEGELFLLSGLPRSSGTRRKSSTIPCRSGISRTWCSRPSCL